ncbi:uncharacterized protein LOC124360500 [Homalodisca vitripennis]|uniref:uncharacterized protein LOC124360500 n=1 Tax=Homalodisca vitripennis TaxID=197043 RepID=UPI001EEB7270|nr:uncharacterized protein LOC124360500 [Homalodisca vitripennis]KAG8313224.1 hypothetical protein J6590_006783 [Homalodisca vitripennis]
MLRKAAKASRPILASPHLVRQTRRIRSARHYGTIARKQTGKKQSTKAGKENTSRLFVVLREASQGRYYRFERLYPRRVQRLRPPGARHEGVDAPEAFRPLSNTQHYQRDGPLHHRQCDTKASGRRPVSLVK